MEGRLRDAVYGLAVGDAVGVPYEFKRRGSFQCAGMIGYGTHDQPVGTWPDDTGMTLATCASIKNMGKIDCEDIRRQFEAWFYEKKIHRLVKFLTMELLAAKQLTIKKEKMMRGRTARGINSALRPRVAVYFQSIRRVLRIGSCDTKHE